MSVTTSRKLNKYSSVLTQTISQVGSQAMLYGVGLTDEDMHKPQVGIASMGWEGNTCNMHLNALSRRVKQGVQDAGAVGLIFHTIGVSDGISMGTAGMKLSLLSRDIIADSIEAVMRAQWYDANISLPGCDKNMPGVLMAMARVNRPSLMVYGGTISPGILRHPGNGSVQKLDIISAFEATATIWPPTSTRSRCVKSCATLAPAKAPAAACTRPTPWPPPIETLGMSLPYSSSYLPPARASSRSASKPARPSASARDGPEAARHSDPRGIRKRHYPHRHPRRLHERRPASDGHREVHQRRADHRRLPGDLRPHAPARRSEAQRPVRHGRPLRSRRRTCRAEDVATRRLPQRRLYDRHRQDTGREPGNRPRPDRRPEDHHARRRADQGDRAPADPLRQPCGDGRRGQDHRQRGGYASAGLPSVTTQKRTALPASRATRSCR